MLKMLESELAKIEAQALEIEQGLQRRALRQDTMEMSKGELQQESLSSSSHFTLLF